MLEGHHIPHCLNDRTKIIRFIKIASIFHFLVQNHYLRVEKSETMNNLIILAATAGSQGCLHKVGIAFAAIGLVFLIRNGAAGAAIGDFSHQPIAALLAGGQLISIRHHGIIHCVQAGAVIAVALAPLDLEILQEHRVGLAAGVLDVQAHAHQAFAIRDINAGVAFHQADIRNGKVKQCRADRFACRIVMCGCFTAGSNAIPSTAARPGAAKVRLMLCSPTFPCCHCTSI